jgi:hypothetical protein
MNLGQNRWQSIVAALLAARTCVGLGLSLLTAMLLASLVTSMLSWGVVTGYAGGTAGRSSPPAHTIISPASEAPHLAQTEGIHPVFAGSTQTRYPSQLDALSAALEVSWDDADSHKWIGEPWGGGIAVDWLTFDGRETLRAQVTPSVYNWAIMRTDSFPPEDWTAQLALRADIFQEGGASGIDVKLEVRGPAFDPPGDLVETIYCWNLQPDAWNVCTWHLNTALPGYSKVSHLSIVFDQLAGSGPTFYVDDVRLVNASGEKTWDDMDDGSRRWFYFGNWYDWNPEAPFGLEPITQREASPSTPTGSIYMQWDHDNGVDPAGSTAEVGTGEFDDNRDWSGYNRLSADVKASAVDAPLSLFLWDAEGTTAPVDCRGFGTPTRKAGVADTWQTITWDLPWPPCFDNSSIDEIKFVVNDIHKHQTGTLYLDNIALVSDPLPQPVTGLIYVFEDFNDRNPSFNDFSGNWGVLLGDNVTVTFDTAVFTGTWGASLRVDYDLPEDSYTGLWHSLWGHSDYTQTQVLDFTDIYGDLSGEARDFEQLQFWVRGSGATNGRHNIKIELKDATGDYNRTAYRYIAVDDNDTAWRQIVLDADVSNSSFWSYNLEPPDPTRMKQLVFVVESYFNNPTGTFYIDDIQFVDADDTSFDPGQHTDDEFLDLVSEKTFLYFLDWYDPNSGLFQDRSTFPDLMSTAATGFGLTALTIGESRGWIERPLAIEMVARTLHTLDEGQSAVDMVTDAISSTNGYKGFYYHFLDSDGLRKFDNEGLGNELSSVDTAILIMGILTAGEYFHDVPEIRDLAGALYQRVKWDWMLDPANNLFYLAWKPECGPGYQEPAPGGGCFTSKGDGSPLEWDYYTDEVVLIDLLAIGSPSHPVPVDAYYAWAREWGEYGGHTLVQSWNGSLFTYFFAHLWIDFQGRGEDGHPAEPVDWWQNSIEATWANWQFVVDHQDDVACDGDDDYTTYGENSWGLTAAENPCPGDENPYHAYGASPSATSPEHDGTLAPYGAGMATMLLPQKAIPAMKHYLVGTDLWRYRFGFGDACNLDPANCDGPCYNHTGFGIDQGPMLISIENYRSGLVWSTLARNEHIRQAMCLVWPCHEIYLPIIQK